MWAMTCVLAAGFALTACDDDETYAEQKEKERKAINAFLARDPLVLIDQSGDTLLNTGKIKVITESAFEAQDSTTNLAENEYVLFSSSGVYMQIVRQGVGEKLQSGETKRILCRYFEYNILGDSLQTSNTIPYYISNLDILDVSNNSGTITASFNVSDYVGVMYLTYASTVVPNGWIVPLTYVNIGRQTTADEGIAKVRLIVPHSEGTSTATSNVYPCFYEITYQEMRY